MGQNDDIQLPLQANRAIKQLPVLIKGSTMPLFDSPLKLAIPSPPHGDLGWNSCLITGRQDVARIAPIINPPAPQTINVFFDFYMRGHVCASLVMLQYIRGPLAPIGAGNGIHYFYVMYQPAFIRALKFAQEVWIWTSANTVTTDQLATISLYLQFSQMPIDLSQNSSIATPSII